MQLHFSSAEYPQSNGAAESAVKILKRLRQVCSTDGQLFPATLYLQNTAERNHTLSPAQVFLGRSTRTPLAHTVRQVTLPWKKNFLERVEDQRATAVLAHLMQQPREFLPGDSILLHNVCGATVVSKASEPRAYIVEFMSGARSVRNRIFLTPIPRSQPSQRWESVSDEDAVTSAAGPGHGLGPGPTTRGSGDLRPANIAMADKPAPGVVSAPRSLVSQSSSSL
jgi:hypothetical protein